MFIVNKPYWFNEAQIKQIEDLKNAKHMGFWALRTRDGGWSAQPSDIFYVENPDVSKGHSHYFGLHYRTFLGEEMELYITRGDSAFESDILGKLLPTGEVIVSRYCHNYVEDPDTFIMVDGGRDYFRYGWDDKKGGIPKTIKVTVEGPEFKFEEIEDQIIS